ncbi:hypothetical protein GW17_00039710 [Ensete ventricosum]|uniref:Uncharacterized protein n=1 Tax=Ensete ventricosum TaxID=4639 RepID=A0A427AP00_ENSVE|nr:hypothetical protein B296_00011067 [Ensete ventricosum]RWV97496.1 hypothetical protein GW17_00039710 [Ensete ventricosum]
MESCVHSRGEVSREREGASDSTRLLQATAGGGVLAMRLVVEEDLVRSDRGFLSLGRRRADFESDNSEEKDRSQEVKKLLPLTEDTP